MNDITKREDLRAFIQSKIYVIRGIKVMLDRDLADLYGVETRTLNQKVKRNIILVFHQIVPKNHKLH